LLAVRLYGTLQSGGKASEASSFATQWIKDHPKDTTMIQALGEQNMQRKDYAAASANYKQVLDIDPDNVPALNNLAWVMTEGNDRKGIEYAEHAHRLAPFNPGVVDTLGWALAKGGDAKRGLQLLRMASALAPRQGDIRLHLAKALVDSGDKAAARRELTELTKLDKASPIRVEAEKMLATL
jgi:Flp pilus assembly protein TadD